MNAHVLALRAITYIFFRNIFLPITWIAGSLVALLWAIVVILGFLIHTSWLWLLLLVIPLTILTALFFMLIWAAAKRLAPRRITSDERQRVGEFTDKIMRIIELRATPWPVIAALIAKDVLRGRRSGYIDGIINDSKSLKDDFLAVKAMFE